MGTMGTLTLAPILLGVIFYKIPLKVSKILLLLLEATIGVAGFLLLTRTSMEQSIVEFMGGDTPILFIELQGNRLSFAFVCLSVLLFSTAFIYAWKEKYFDNRYLLLLLVLQGLINGLIFTDDLFNIFILMEVSTVVATVLIMYRREERSTYDGLYYFIIQVVSMLFYLLGLAYIYRIFGVLSISEVARLVPLADSRSLILPFSLMMAGIGLKIGLFPLFSWVSKAYGTPSAPFPVMAILSGLFIKISLLLFVRLDVLFYPVIDYRPFLLVLGFITGITGFAKAIGQKNIKLILAYSTISQIGLLIMGLFSGSEVGYWGSMYHIFNHAILKVLLFFAAGLLVEAYQTKNIYEIRGVLKRLPLVSFVLIIGILGITGFPFLNGSMSKYWLMYGVPPIVELGMWLVNIGTILTYIKFGRILFGTNEETDAPKNPLKTGMVFLLSALSIIGGLFGRQIVSFIFQTNLPFSMTSFMEKAGVYFLLMIAGILIYLLAHKKRLSTWKNNFLYLYLQGTISLPTSVFYLLLFFLALMIYGMKGSF